MIDPVTGCFEMENQGDKRAIYIENLAETTWVYRYPRPVEIRYDQGSEFIGHEFRKSQIEIEYGINDKPSTSRNPMSNMVLERIHQVLGNLMRNFNIYKTYVEKYDPWTVILAAA